VTTPTPPLVDPLRAPEPGDALTAYVHLYRGEMHRMTMWRQRLDITSNWAIILTTALTTFTLGAQDVPHYTLLLGLGIIAISILIEARRYRHLHHSKWRLFLLESGLFAQLLDPAGQPPEPQWRELLAEDLRQAVFSLSWFSAIRARLRRNYLMLVYFVTAVWIVKLVIHPAPSHGPDELFQHLWVGNIIPPWFVATTAVLFIVVSTMLAVSCPTTEELDDWGGRARGAPPPSCS
jgi:uncharacterized membrane protein